MVLTGNVIGNLIFTAAIAAPLVGSGIAFALQLGGIVFLTLFGAVVGFLIWTSTPFVLIIAIVQVGRAVHGNATLLKQIKGRLTPPRS